MSDTVDLVLPNIAEFNLRHPRLALDPASVRGFLRFGRAMSDQSVFWSDGPRVLVLPEGVDPDWFADVHDAQGQQRPPLVCPRWHTGLLTADLLDDVDALAALRGHLRDFRRVQFVSWGATKELYRLSATIRGFGHDVVLDVPPPEHYWSSLYFDSKLSCLDMAAQLPSLRTAPGITTQTWEELRGVLDAMLAAGERVIVRGMYGSAGEGSAVVDPDPASLARFWDTVHEDPLLRIFPLAVQRYLPHHPEVACPAVDMLIGDDAEDGVVDLVPSVLTVDGHRFVSVNVGHGIASAAVEEQMEAISRQVATVARRLGFRGWFGIDFLVDRQGELYVTEFNARRTGGTQWIPLLDRWDPPRRAVAHLRHAIALPASAPDPVAYADLRPAFRRCWQQDAVVLPVAVRSLTHPRRRSYGIVTAGDTAAAAERLADAVRRDIATRLGGEPA